MLKSKKHSFFKFEKKEFRQTDGQEIPNTFCLRVKITSIQTELGQNIAQNGNILLTQILFL